MTKRKGIEHANPQKEINNRFQESNNPLTRAGTRIPIRLHNRTIALPGDVVGHHQTLKPDFLRYLAVASDHSMTWKTSTGSAWRICWHIIFWVIYVILEFMVNRVHLDPGMQWTLLKSILLALPALLIPTYILTGYIIPRFLYKNKWSQFILAVIIMAIFIFFVRIKWTELINFFESGKYFRFPASKLLKNLIRDYAVIALAVCISIIADYRRTQKRNSELIKAKAEAEIKLLKGQLHPHFLFNSLNNIYSLALSRSDKTADSILKLTELLEYLLYKANQEKVPLIREVELIEHYMDLERLRHGDKLRIVSEISLHNELLHIAPLILLPFAENCFKHGGVGADGLFHIRLALQTDARQVSFRLSNSKPRREKTAGPNGGIGLENIRKRLELLYPDRHQLDIRDDPDTFSVHLTVSL